MSKKSVMKMLLLALPSSASFHGASEQRAGEAPSLAGYEQTWRLGSCVFALGQGLNRYIFHISSSSPPSEKGSVCETQFQPDLSSHERSFS